MDIEVTVETRPNFSKDSAPVEGPPAVVEVVLLTEAEQAAAAAKPRVVPPAPRQRPTLKLSGSRKELREV